jgi:hypothetical protein
MSSPTPDAPWVGVTPDPPSFSEKHDHEWVNVTNGAGDLIAVHCETCSKSYETREKK